MAARNLGRQTRSDAGAASPRSRRARPRGRALVAALLVGFVLVAVGVVWRRSYGTVQASILVELERRRATLEAERALLHRQVRAATSRSRLVPIAQRRLLMQVPNDSQIVILPRPSSRDSTRGGRTP